MPALGFIIALLFFIGLCLIGAIQEWRHRVDGWGATAALIPLAWAYCVYVTL